MYSTTISPRQSIQSDGQLRHAQHSHVAPPPPSPPPKPKAPAFLSSLSSEQLLIIVIAIVLLQSKSPDWPLLIALAYLLL